MRESGAMAKVVGRIGVDSRPARCFPTLADGTPLARLPQYSGNPHAWDESCEASLPHSQATHI